LKDYVVDFRRHWADYARYLPALNQNFVRFAHSSDALRQGTVSQSDTNFLDPSTPLFFAPDVLYTAAFAVNDNQPNIITARDRDHTFVLGDSGGFSLISGAVKYSVSSFRQAVLEWQERECDAGLPVDIPTGALQKPQSGYSSVADCLDATIKNTEWMIQNRSNTRMTGLCVYQGRNKAEADRWATAMQPYQRQLEGMAIAGATRLQMADWVERIVKIAHEGQLEQLKHIHFLGTNQPRFAVLATALQRALRAYVSSDVRVTFDSSTSFTFVQKYGQVTTGLLANGSDFRMTDHTMPRRGGDFSPNTPFPYRSPLADLHTIGDFMPGRNFAQSAVDSKGANMLSHHSVYAELSAIIQANRLVDMAQQAGKSVVPYGLTKAVELIDQVFRRGGDPKALSDLKALQRKSVNTIPGSVEDRPDQ
jgi:hypothetical protein